MTFVLFVACKKNNYNNKINENLTKYKLRLGNANIELKSFLKKTKKKRFNGFGLEFRKNILKNVLKLFMLL